MHIFTSNALWKILYRGIILIGRNEYSLTKTVSILSQAEKDAKRKAKEKERKKLKKEQEKAKQVVFHNTNPSILC